VNFLFLFSETIQVLRVVLLLGSGHLFLHGVLALLGNGSACSFDLGIVTVDGTLETELSIKDDIEPVAADVSPCNNVVNLSVRHRLALYGAPRVVFVLSGNPLLRLRGGGGSISIFRLFEKSVHLKFLVLTHRVCVAGGLLTEGIYNIIKNSV